MMFGGTNPHAAGKHQRWLITKSCCIPIKMHAKGNKLQNLTFNWLLAFNAPIISDLGQISGFHG